MFYIYILFSDKARKFYVGYSQDPWKRLFFHNQDNSHKYTGKFFDWKLSAVFEVSTSEADAIKLERFIKKQKSRKLIIKLIHPEFIPTDALAQLVRVPHVRD